MKNPQQYPSHTINPWDVIRDLSYDKKGLLTPDNQDEYPPFLINKAFSYYTDTVFYANEMNKHHQLDKPLQHDFYLHALRKRKRYSPWNKKDELKIATTKSIATYFNYSYSKAKAVLPLLTDADIAHIIEQTAVKEDK